jgi:hypothetical protein
MSQSIEFTIEYVVLNSQGRVIKDGEIIVKHKATKFEAQCSLEIYLQKKYPEFKSMIVNKCTESSPFMGLFNDIFGKNKNNPFGGSNPFKF